MTYRKVCPPEKLSHVPEMLRILPSMGERMNRGPLGLVRKMEVPLHMSRAHSLGAEPGCHHGAPSGTLPIGARERWWWRGGGGAADIPHGHSLLELPAQSPRQQSPNFSGRIPPRRCPETSWLNLLSLTEEETEARGGEVTLSQITRLDSH